MRKVNLGRAGFGAKLDVLTLTGLGAKKRKRKVTGLWEELYRDRGGFPTVNGMKKRKKKKRKCVAWKPVGTGCDCKPVCASYTSPKKGMSKKRATAKCESKCKTRTRTKRKRRK
jgi:hypothetical protein